jgi:hypothetical protein
VQVSSAVRHRALSTRARLFLLVTAVLVPVSLFAAVLLWRFSEAERVRYEADALELSQRVSAAIDRELTGLTAALEALATSPALQAGGDLAAFDAQARAVLRTRGSFIAMRDRTGQQIVNTGRPFGTPLPVSTDPVLLALIARSSRPDAQSSQTSSPERQPASSLCSSTDPCSATVPWPLPSTSHSIPLGSPRSSALLQHRTGR